MFLLLTLAFFLSKYRIAHTHITVLIREHEGKVS